MAQVAGCRTPLGRASRTLLVALVASATLATGFAPGDGLVPHRVLGLGQLGSSPAPPGEDRPSLLLVTLDTVRADRLGSYGYEDIETPNLDRLAREGVRFEQVASTAPLTLPAHASILTGQYPFRHGVRDNVNFRLPEGASTLAEVLRAAGYATGGFVGAFVLDAQTGIAQGFDTYTEFREMGLPAAPVGGAELERRADVVVGQALGWIASQPGPFFAWVHLFDPHLPYRPPAPYDERYAGRPYDGEIAFTDQAVGALLGGIEASGRASDTVVIVTADHGEALGEHGEHRHSLFVYDSTIRVPLILWGPGRLPSGLVVDGQASVVDVLPTALALLGVPDSAAATRDGIDLQRLVEAPDDPGRPVYAESLVALLELGWSELRSLRSRAFKYVAAPRPELYELRTDPGETDNAAARLPRQAAAMRAHLEELVAGDAVVDLEFNRRGVDPSAAARLRSLGYVGSGLRMTHRTRTDPKGQAAVFEGFQDAVSATAAALERGDLTGARAHLQDLQGLVPGHPLVHYYRGRAALLSGEPAAAVEDLERAVALAPSYSLAWADLAQARRAVGDGDAAVALLRLGLESFPTMVTFPLRLGTYLESDGDLEGALEAYEAARAVSPRHPGALRGLARLHLLRSDHVAARQTLRLLVEIRGDDADAWVGLASAHCHLVELEPCAEALRRAADLVPTAADTRVHLGRVLLEMGRRGEAVAAFREALRIDPLYEPARLELRKLDGG